MMQSVMHTAILFHVCFDWTFQLQLVNRHISLGAKAARFPTSSWVGTGLQGDIHYRFDQQKNALHKSQRRNFLEETKAIVKSTAFLQQNIQKSTKKKPRKQNLCPWCSTWDGTIRHLDLPCSPCFGNAVWKRLPGIFPSWLSCFRNKVCASVVISTASVIISGNLYPLSNCFFSGDTHYRNNLSSYSFILP